MANLIDTESGDRVDFWMLAEGPFDRSRVARRHLEEVLEIQVAVSSPEDTIPENLSRKLSVSFPPEPC